MAQATAARGPAPRDTSWSRRECHAACGPIQPARVASVPLCRTGSLGEVTTVRFLDLNTSQNLGQTSSQSLSATGDLTMNTVPEPATPQPGPAAVTLREVGLRDGLQAVARTLPTAHKLAWIAAAHAAAHAAGLREVEVGSFVPARQLPQLADTAELVDLARSLPGLTTLVLVPNLKGAQRAIESQADVMLLPKSASHAHSLANLRRTPDAVVADIARIRDLRDAAALTCILEVGISTAFGCTIQGVVEPDEVLRLLQAELDAAAERVGLADTVGYADPLHVGRLFAQARQAPSGRRKFRAHLPPERRQRRPADQHRLEPGRPTGARRAGRAG